MWAVTRSSAHSLRNIRSLNVIRRSRLTMVSGNCIKYTTNCHCIELCRILASTKGLGCYGSFRRSFIYLLDKIKIRMITVSFASYIRKCRRKHFSVSSRQTRNLVDVRMINERMVVTRSSAQPVRNIRSLNGTHGSRVSGNSIKSVTRR